MRLFVLLFIIGYMLKAQELFPDANDFLSLHHNNLIQTYDEVLQGSIKRQFMRYRGYQLIDYGIYKRLAESERTAIKKPLIFFRGIITSKPLYSEYGGVSIRAIFIRESKDDNKTKPILLNFAGRYLSDLLIIGENSEFYALCAPPYVNRCVLLGIGERW